MEKEKNNLVKKISWTKGVEDVLEKDDYFKLVYRCKELEKEGFGMLASECDSSVIDKSYSVVCPDGEVFTPQDIRDYWERRKGRYSSRNPHDFKMHKVRVYYLGLREK